MYACALLKHMSAIPTPPDVQPFLPRRIITTEDNTNAWQRANERTSAGLSGLHFAMFKAHASCPYLSSINAALRSIAYATGFSYTQWKWGVNVQLLKKSKDLFADKLHTILLLEADFNMNNKAMGNDIMQVGKRYQAFAKDNYGGRRGHHASEV